MRRAGLCHLLLAGVLIAGTGGASAAPELATFAVTLRAGRIVPARLEVPAGVKIKLTLRNEGPGPCEFENLALRVEKVLAPGASSFVVIHPLRPGSYTFIDEFHPTTGTLLLIAR
jgi:hypothetical protein